MKTEIRQTERADTGFDYPSYRPPAWLRSGFVQTAIASFKFRKRGPNPVLDHAQPMTLDCGHGVRLAGAFSDQPEAKGLVIFIHGWEGSQDSTYVLSCSRNLYKAGCAVFRLNLRDHGDTHHLNEEIFHSARLDEVVAAIKQIAKLADGVPVYLVGFSLGGNFALRAIADMDRNEDRSLSHVFAISPVVDPVSASPKVDINPIYRRYFLKKWTRSLRRKAELYPDLYSFPDLHRIRTVMEVTDTFVPLHTPFDTKEDYFASYQLSDDALAHCKTPISIIHARDDGLVPASAIETLNLPSAVRAMIFDHGGHNGFFQSLLGPTWYDGYIEHVINAEIPGEA